MSSWSGSSLSLLLVGLAFSFKVSEVLSAGLVTPCLRRGAIADCSIGPPGPIPESHFDFLRVGFGA